MAIQNDGGIKPKALDSNHPEIVSSKVPTMSGQLPKIGSKGLGSGLSSQGLGLETQPLSITLGSGDDFSSMGLSVQGPAVTLASTSDPYAGVFGSGQPIGPLGGSLPSVFTGPLAKRVDPLVFAEANRANPIMSRPIIANADHFKPAEDQTFVDLARQVYGPQLGESTAEETLALLGEGIARLNGRSNLEAPPSVVAIPDLKDVNRFLTGLRRDLKMGPPTVRPSVGRFGGSNSTRRALPTPDHAYLTRWNDTLRGITLHAFGAELIGLSPEEADFKLQLMMMVNARINQLNTTDLSDAGVIWMPRPQLMNHALNRLAKPGDLARLQRRNPGLWQSIQRTGRGALADLAFFGRKSPAEIVPATSPNELAAVIDNAAVAVRSARCDRVLDGPAGHNYWGMFSWNWLLECHAEEPPEGEKLPIRRSYETLDDFLDRVAPNLPPEEYLRVLENPGALMMRAAKIIDGDGQIDEAKQQEFMSAMSSLGLADSTGTWVVADPEPNESPRAYADRISIDAARRAGIEIEYKEGDTLEQVFDQILAAGTPQEKALARNLVIWNQLVVLGSEALGDPATGSQVPGPGSYMEGLFGKHVYDPFIYGGYMPPPAEIGDDFDYRSDADILLDGWVDIESVEKKRWLDSFRGDDGSERSDLEADITVMEARAQAALDELQRSVDMNPEERRRQEKTYKMALEALAHAKGVAIETIAANLEINRKEAEGKPIGGRGSGRSVQRRS